MAVSEGKNARTHSGVSSQCRATCTREQATCLAVGTRWRFGTWDRIFGAYPASFVSRTFARGTNARSVERSRRRSIVRGVSPGTIGDRPIVARDYGRGVRVGGFPDVDAVGSRPTGILARRPAAPSLPLR